MGEKKFTRAALFVCVAAIIAIAAWELYLRNAGYQISYDDGAALWSEQRDRVYEDNATVFIGSSRIKYDLDISEWEKLTGEEAVQLSMEGTQPRPILQNLANDERFKGKLVIDVTEPLFFYENPGAQSDVRDNLAFYKDNHTPAQKSSFLLNKVLERQFVFLDKDAFSLNSMLSRLDIPSRKNVFVFPVFPIGFGRVTPGRQTYMTDEFVADSNQVNQVKNIWKMLGSKKEPPPDSVQRKRIFDEVSTAINKIRSRGGTVVFVRTPSSGEFLMGETMGFPREKFWDKLLEATNCQGIHFKDDPETANFICPELSHLTRRDATLYTRSLVKNLRSINWFANKTTAK